MVTVRACDSCVCRRAQWYCAADDAFLCQNCDSSVHSANPLARRHDRVRLQTNSISLTRKLAPAWHHGFKRKARTPRPCKAKIPATAAQPLVPEIETSNEDESNREERLLYQVPIFDPMIAEFCATPNLESKPGSTMNCTTLSNNNDRFLAGLLPSDVELAEFAENMEGLLGHNDSFSMEELGLVDAKHMSGSSSNHEVKEELENSKDVHKDVYEEIDLSRETLEINFDAEDKETTKTMAVAVEEAEEEEEQEEEGKSNNRIGLRLDYEAIVVEWSANRGCLSPWMNGERPRLGADDCWLHFMGMWGVGEAQGITPGEIGGSHFDEGREARVSRYREKRRTRLFSKKIRYEVRKLNAEKRPRMKG